jgi:hypothetical protein
MLVEVSHQPGAWGQLHHSFSCLNLRKTQRLKDFLIVDAMLACNLQLLNKNPL